MAIIVHHEHQSPKPYLAFLREVYAGERRGVNPPATDQVAAEEVAAYVNHGRWIAECETCKWAIVASAQTPLFLCGSCGNSAFGGKWRRVAYPSDKAVIEYQLLKRAAETNRNWKPGERVSDLIRENAAAGAL